MVSQNIFISFLKFSPVLRVGPSDSRTVWLMELGSPCIPELSQSFAFRVPTLISVHEKKEKGCSIHFFFYCRGCRRRGWT